jgi:hypothetical protein
MTPAAFPRALIALGQLAAAPGALRAGAGQAFMLGSKDWSLMPRLDATRRSDRRYWLLRRRPRTFTLSAR